MKSYNLQKELEISKKISIEAGNEILKVYNTNFNVEYKEDKSPLTEADKKSNELIVKKLNQAFPNYSTLSEEYEDDKSRLHNDWCWIIDPLDGTKEFLKKNGEFTVNIALSHKHKVVLGVVYVPVANEIYYAIKGNGAYSEIKGKINKLRVSDRIDNLILLKSRSHASDQLERLMKENSNKIFEIKPAGSSMKGCLIAKGEADIYYRFGLTMEWDTAAMQCVIEEAGGIFRQLDDTQMLYNRINSLNDKGFYILNKIENKFN
ncbi:MAG: 3'(2'),5'-bisphosphate nucleotidase CysQ [Spirochaetes bacterium]|nr:3'(2'),5'-bisphosphate nucleotidase CysQ [Spirochaetota bacterium]